MYGGLAPWHDPAIVEDAATSDPMLRFRRTEMRRGTEPRYHEVRPSDREHAKRREKLGESTKIADVASVDDA